MNKRQEEEPPQKSTLHRTHPIYRSGIGQDSHRFLPEDSSKPCILGGVIFDDVPGLDADSDGDVILHAICNAITSISGVPILGGIAREICQKDGITDSFVYLEKALETLGGKQISHLAITIEAKKPVFQPKVEELRKNISRLMKLQLDQVGVTATSGDGLTDFGCGQGIQCICILSTIEF